jgi:hypothetical protein
MPDKKFVLVVGAELKARLVKYSAANSVSQAAITKIALTEYLDRNEKVQKDLPREGTTKF